MARMAPGRTVPTAQVMSLRRQGVNRGFGSAAPLCPGGDGFPARFFCCPDIDRWRIKLNAF